MTSHWLKGNATIHTSYLGVYYMHLQNVMIHRENVSNHIAKKLQYDFSIKDTNPKCYELYC